MNFTSAHDFNSQIAVANASDSAAATAGGAGDATLVTGQAIDRFAFNRPQSAAFLIRYKAVLGATNTLSFSASVETAIDSAFTVPVVLSTVAAAVAATGPAGGGTVRSVVRVGVDLAGALQYVRLKFTPDLSAASVDTAEASAVAVFGGEFYLPA